jgi:cytochrome c-type biogenesis protein
MTLELMSIPLALLAGMLSILSPCVWPLVPVVMTSAATSGRSGPWFLALGLSTSFAVAGTLVTYLLLNAGLNPDAYRVFAALLLVLLGLILAIPWLSDQASYQLSKLSNLFSVASGPSAGGRAGGQFAVGALLGLVWLPCVGPTLGAAIGLASMGQDMGMAFVIMFTFGIGTTSVLLAAGLLSGRVLSQWRPGIMAHAGRAKVIMGWMLLVLGLLVLTGVDKMLETWALQILPDWATSL